MEYNDSSNHDSENHEISRTGKSEKLTNSVNPDISKSENLVNSQTRKTEKSRNPENRKASNHIGPENPKAQISNN